MTFWDFVDRHTFVSVLCLVLVLIVVGTIVAGMTVPEHQVGSAFGGGALLGGFVLFFGGMGHMMWRDLFS